MRREGLALLLLASMTSCGVVRQNQTSAEGQKIVADCKLQINSTSAAHLLASKTGVADARDITPTMIADEALPTAAEIAAVRELEPLVNDCGRRLVDFVERHEESAFQVFEAGRVTNLEITGAFERGNIPWGEYNRLKLEAYKISLQALQATEQQAKAVDAMQQQATAAQTANFIQALQGVASNLRANQPTVTNCIRTGTAVNCISR